MERDGLQRVGVFAELPALLLSLGVDPGPVFRPFGVDMATLSMDARLPLHMLLAILDRAAAAASRPDLGLSLGNRADHRSLGLVGEMMDCAPTVGRALEDYVSVQGGLSQAQSAYLIPMGEIAALGYGVYDRYAPSVEHLYAVSVAVSVNGLRRLTGGRIEVTEVHFSHRTPVDPRPYERILKARVRFNCEQTAVLFPRSGLREPNPHADPRRHADLSERVITALRLKEATTAQRLRHQMRPALSLGDGTAEALARRLALSPRSLNRRLAEDGTTFSTERDAVRFVMACELLALTDLSVGDISLALAYANHSAFARSFRRWSDLSPSAWRQAHAPAPTGA